MRNPNPLWKNEHSEARLSLRPLMETEGPAGLVEGAAAEPSESVFHKRDLLFIRHFSEFARQN